MSGWVWPAGLSVQLAVHWPGRSSLRSLDLVRWQRDLSLLPVDGTVCGATACAEIYAVAGGVCRWWADGKDLGERIYTLSLCDAVLQRVGFRDDVLVRAGREDDTYRLLLAETRSMRDGHFDLPG